MFQEILLAYKSFKSLLLFSFNVIDIQRNNEQWAMRFQHSCMSNEKKNKQIN